MEKQSTKAMVAAVAEVNAPQKFEFLSDNTDRKVKGVVNQAGWFELNTKSDFEELKKINNPSRGSKHVPIQHYDAVQLFGDRVSSNTNIKIDRQIGLLSPNTEKFLLMCEIKDDSIKDFSFILGFVSFNDKTRAISVISSTNAFVCSNLKITGIMSEKQKHLNGVTDGTAKVFDLGIANFEQYRDKRVKQIERSKNVEVDDKILSDIVLQMHRSEIFGKNPMMISNILKEFTNDIPRHDEFGSRSTLWSLENAMTEVSKNISPIRTIGYNQEFDRIVDKYITR